MPILPELPSDAEMTALLQLLEESLWRKESGDYEGAIAFSAYSPEHNIRWYYDQDMGLCPAGSTRVDMPRDKFFTATHKGVTYYGAVMVGCGDARGDLLLWTLTGITCVGKAFFFISEEARDLVTGKR